MVAKQRGPGRPQRQNGEDEVHQRLTQTALRLAAQKGIANVSVRQVAEVAGVTPAMINYYFGSKRGLFEAALDEVTGLLLPRLRETLKEGSAAEESLTGFVQSITTVLLAEPLIPSFIIKEVVLGDAHLRERFIKIYASEIAALIPMRILNEIKRGNFRSDLNPFYALISLIGMTIFPFLARPVAEAGLGISFDESFRNTFAQHTSKLFLHGAMPQEGGSK